MCIHPCFPKGSRNKRDSQFSQSYREPFGISVVPVALLRLFFLLVTLVERRANVAALFRVVSSGVMPRNRLSGCILLRVPSQSIDLHRENKVIILITKTCPNWILSIAQAHEQPFFRRCPQKKIWRFLKSNKTKIYRS